MLCNLHTILTDGLTVSFSIHIYYAAIVGPAVCAIYRMKDCLN